MVAMTEPIVEYLADLERTLRRVGRSSSDILAEVEDHLREAAEHGYASGLSSEAAQRQAVSTFGEPAMLAARLKPPATASRAFITAVSAIGVLMIAGFGLGLQARFPLDEPRSGISLGWAQPLEEQPSRVLPRPPAYTTPDAQEVPMRD